MEDKIIEHIEEFQDDLAIKGRDSYSNKEVRDMFKGIMDYIKGL